MSDNCPLCDEESQVGINAYERRKVVDCPNCGKFGITNIAESKIGDVKAKAIISHSVWRMNRSGQPPNLEAKFVEQILAAQNMPTHIKQANNLIIYVGDELLHEGRSGGRVIKSRGEFRAPVGVVHSQDLRWILSHLVDSKFIDVNYNYSERHQDKIITGTSISLTFQGWNEYEKLTRRKSDSRKAFMAMQYGDSVLDKMYETCFKPAVAQTNFDLTRLDEIPKAGILDNHLRVEIRNSRFLISDLTHNNRGAYWEAGFAEGLDKPVIFLCEESVFNSDDSNVRPHFDANHHQVVIWRQDEKDEASQALKDVIRATLPGEAKMED